MLLVFAGSIAAQQSVTLTSVRDNTLYQSTSGNLSNGAGTGMFAGRTDDSTRRRAVVAWNLSSIPAGATIQSVQIQLQVTQTQAGATNVAAHRLTANWGEGTSIASSGGGGGASSTTNDATWIHRFYNTQSWTSAGGDFVATPSATQSVAGNASYTWGSTSALVADVQGWVANPASNFGWIFIGNESTDQTAKRFATREATNAASRPRLIVTYSAGTPASATIVGSGCLGSTGQALSLTPQGLPTLGTTTFAVNVANGPAGAPAFLFLAVGLAPAPFIYNGCPVYLDIASLFAFAGAGVSPLGPFTLNSAGAITIPAPMGTDPGLAGVRVDVQAIVVDTASVNGTTTSNALTLVLGY
jgi:hypothetical protein